MIISYSKGFVFWRPLKVGGSSVLQALGKHCSGDDIVNVPEPISEAIKAGLEIYGRNYTGYATHQLPHLVDSEKTTGLFKFSIVRNPWDMTFSMYCWTKESNDSFTSWLERWKDDYFFHECFWFYNGKKTSDFYMKFENLQDDYNFVCNKIGIPEEKLPWLKLDRLEGSLDYRTHYSGKQIELVASKFPQIIKEFGYKYENN